MQTSHTYYWVTDPGGNFTIWEYSKLSDVYYVPGVEGGFARPDGTVVCRVALPGDEGEMKEKLEELKRRFVEECQGNAGD